MSLLQFLPASVSSTIAATNANQRVALPVTSSAILVRNIGSKEAFIALGGSTVAATAGGAATAASDGSMSVPAGFFAIISTGGAGYVAAITAGADTTTLRITPGEGII